jgi:CBS domain-containing protein
MICPFCHHDNIAGDDVCDECGQSLVGLADGGTDLVETISRHNVNVLNPRRPVTLAASSTLEQAIDAMTENRIGCLLVTSDSALLGIITERDVLNKAADDPTNMQRPVSEFMTAGPETIRGQDSIAYALHAMDLGGYRHLPILDAEGRPTGIISIRDVLRFLCIRFADARAND